MEPALPGGEVDLGLFDLWTYADWVAALKQLHGDGFDAWAQAQVLREQHPKRWPCCSTHGDMHRLA